MGLLMLSLACTSHCLTPDLMMRAGHLKVLTPLAFLNDPTGWNCSVALHLHYPPCSNIPSHLAQLPACWWSASPSNSLLDLSWGHSLDIAQVAPSRKTDALAAVPLCLWLCALPYVQHLTLKRVSAPRRPKPCSLDLGASGPAHMRHVDTDATYSWQGLSHASLSVQLSNSACQHMFLPLLQELVSFPVTLDDEVSEAGSDLKADDPMLPDQQPAAQTGLKERRHVFSKEPAPGDMAAEQVRQLPLLNCQLPAASPHLR